MIPRTVQMAKAVEATFTTPQVEDYGNVILNGYLSVVPNTINKKAWQYKETATAPVNLPSLTEVQPALKGWTTNYMEYYTQIPPNGYGVNPGDPTMFEYSVHSFTIPAGPIATIGGLKGGSAYTAGSYTNLPTIGGAGTGATLDIVVGPGGFVSSVTLNSAGSGYNAGDTLFCPTSPSGGSGDGFQVSVFTITVVTPLGNPKWAQPPRRFNQLTVGTFTPPTRQSNAIQYSYMYPVADNLNAPPIDVL